ncbi:MAG: hypothetical protein QW666_03300 [Candidatus Woesearchaeota archaeon]
MVDELKDISIPNEEEEYELLPHKEIEELKSELQKLKEFEITPTKKLSVSLLELNKKLDKLLAIFDEATHMIKSEEMGLTFKERMKPISDKMDKILEQNADIAEGIVAIADMVKEMKGVQKTAEKEEELGTPEFDFKPEFPMAPPAPGVLPPMPQGPRPQMPPRPMAPPPLPPRKPRTFGII